MTVRIYQEDSNYEESFKHLLQPIEPIFLKVSQQIFKYELCKELESYLNHLKRSTNPLNFINAALVLQNIEVLYKTRVDAIINDMMEFIGKNRSYRINERIGSMNITNKNENQKIKSTKNVKCYSDFEPIKIEISKLKIYDCKSCNLSKKRPVPNIVLNTFIKVNNKYNTILPYIYDSRGAKIGKKYDFKISFPLDCNLAVNEEMYCPINETNDDSLFGTFEQRNGTFSLAMDMLDVNNDDIEILPCGASSPLHIDETINDDRSVTNILQNATLLNVNKMLLKNAIKSQSVNGRRNKSEESPKKKLHKTKHDALYLPPAFIKTEHDEEINVSQHNSDEPVNDVNIDPLPQINEVNDLNHNHENGQMEVVMDEQSEMRKRVEKWHNQLKPILESDKIEYNVHEYGSRIINCFENIGDKKLFKDLVGGLDKEEVARYYLSLIMMVNTNNVELTSDILENDFVIKLLKKERHHNELQINIGNQVKNQTQNEQ